jgi:hypothetical protein
MADTSVVPISQSPSFRHCDLRALSRQELMQFNEQGFLKITALAPPDDILEVRRIIDNLYARRQKEYGSIDGLLALDHNLKDTATYHSCLKIAKQILGCTTGYACDNSLYKEPHGRHGTPWHQDGAFHGRYFPNNTLAFWIPLQDATLENGCMHYIPLRKGQILLPHRPYYPNDYRSATTDCVDATLGVACPLQAGDAAVHGPLTLHSALANSTDLIRRTWLLTFRPWGKWGFFAPSRLFHRVRVIHDRFRWRPDN